MKQEHYWTLIIETNNWPLIQDNYTITRGINHYSLDEKNLEKKHLFEEIPLCRSRLHMQHEGNHFEFPESLAATANFVMSLVRKNLIY